MQKKIIICLLSFILMSPATGFTEIVNQNEIYTYKRFTDDAKKIKEIYPDIVEIRKIGSTFFGRDILALKLGKGKRNILIVGSHHGREWLTSTLLMVMLEQYADSYRKGQSYGTFSTRIFDEIAIWFVPMLNPDGVTIQQSGVEFYPESYHDKLFEMNGYSPDFSKWKANGLGVDLNRQYQADWNNLKESVPIPWYQLYKGKKPFTEQEVKAIQQFTERIHPLIAVSYHSSGREIFWEYKNGRNLIRDKQLAHKISLLTGYKLSTPLNNAIGGGFTDWFIATYQRPGFTIEISPLVGQTNPPLSIFTEEWRRNELVGIFLAAEAKKLK